MALHVTRRCVDHLCELLIVQCQGGLERKEGSELGLTEKLAKWGVSNGGAAAAGKDFSQFAASVADSTRPGVPLDVWEDQVDAARRGELERKGKKWWNVENK